MAWTNILDADIDGDSPIKPSLMESLRDNSISIANGDAGAPQFQTNSIEDGAITGDKITNYTIQPAKWTW